MRKLISLGLSQLLLTAGLISGVQAEPDSLAKFMNELGRQKDPVTWLKQQEANLRSDHTLTRRLSLELLAESLRQGPQPWPVQARATLEVLLQIQPQPDIQEALNPNLFTPQTPLRELIQNADDLQQNPALPALKKQLSLCYRLNILTCQAHMHQRIGQVETLPEKDRLAAFQVGQVEAEQMGHTPLILLNDMGMALVGKNRHEGGLSILAKVLETSRILGLNQVEALSQLEWGRYLLYHNAPLETINENFAKSLALWSDTRHQSLVHFEIGNLFSENAQDSRARISWDQALALSNPNSDRILHLQISEKLAASLLEDGSYEIALPHLKNLVEMLPAGSEKQILNKIRLIEALTKTQPEKSNVLINDVMAELQTQSYGFSYSNWIELAMTLERIEQPKNASKILENLAMNNELSTSFRLQALQKGEQLFPERAAFWALSLMTSEEFELREAAVNALNRLRPEALVPSLLALLKHPDPRVRGNVIQVLWFTSNEKILSELRILLDDPHPHIRQNLIGAFSYAEAWTLEHIPASRLVKLLQPPLTHNHVKVLELLSLSSPGREYLLSMAQNPESDLQAAALDSLTSKIMLTSSQILHIIPILGDHRAPVAFAASNLLSSQENRTHWKEIVRLIQTNPDYYEPALNVLTAWKTPQAVRELRTLVKSQKQEFQKAYINLFDSAPMTDQDADLLMPLLNSQVPEHTRFLAIGALLPLKSPPAWQQFEQLISEPAIEGTMSFSHGLVLLNKELPCLPPSAFIHANHWLPNPSDTVELAILRKRWLQAANPQRIWNGKACGPFKGLPTKLQNEVKQALIKLYKSEADDIKLLLLPYLKAWAPETL